MWRRTLNEPLTMVRSLTLCPSNFSLNHDVHSEAAYNCLGYAPPDGWWNPLTDPSLPPGEGAKLFPAWVSGYYKHGKLPVEVEMHTPLKEPQPTLATMTDEEVESSIYPPPGNPGGSDETLYRAGKHHSYWTEIRKLTFFPEVLDDTWAKIPLRFVWGDRSIWEVPYGKWCIEGELEEAKAQGKFARVIELVKLPGANHFVSCAH